MDIVFYAYAPNGAVEKIGLRPRWLGENGEPATDAQLKAGDWFPLNDGDQAHDPETQHVVEKPMAEWTVGTEYATRTYDVVDLTADEISQREAARQSARNYAVNDERDRRIAAGFTFNGVRFQSRPEDRENIMGAFALASTALTVGGKLPDDPRWHGGDEDFAFIAEDNSRVPMDASTVLAFGQTAAAQKSTLTFAANDLKKLDPIPPDFADDSRWPAF